jgi:hypothetical protein
MKIYTYILLLSIPFLSLGQRYGVGSSKSQILSSSNSNPCHSDENTLWYCVADGSTITYTFKYNLVSKVFFKKAFKSKAEAEFDVSNEITRLKGIYGTPEIKEEFTFWFSENLMISVFYGYINGGHFSCMSVTDVTF